MTKFFKRGLIGSAVAALALTASVSGVSAQSEETDSPWVKVCNVDPKVNKEICLITQELRTNTGQFLASVALREIEGEARKTLLIAVPTGMLIQPGLRVQIDSGKQTNAKYGICFPNACYSELVIDDSFVASMKQGGKMVLTTLNQQAKAIPMDLTLIGFTKVYEGEPMDVAELQEKQEKLQNELQRRADEARQKLIDAQEQAQ
ncbi:invasion protein IalB [Roseibium hamelinense]|uniref:Invasion protein IalB n=1 Tax=Roseibium hamelinense TaxID=150831 RepID=A0A562TH97_9HYPH|nr:invasion associated locus B family protein [Roseibium hamelinense]MTI45800.1 invasion associated locus B family protein [Roseibium hamelinense]TWI93017.1 invasion protein IalB [Roseibium hamelinense]